MHFILFITILCFHKGEFDVSTINYENESEIYRSKLDDFLFLFFPNSCIELYSVLISQFTNSTKQILNIFSWFYLPQCEPALNFFLTSAKARCQFNINSNSLIINPICIKQLAQMLCVAFETFCFNCSLKTNCILESYLNCLLRCFLINNNVR